MGIASFAELWCSELRTYFGCHFDDKSRHSKTRLWNLFFITVVTAWHACCSLSHGR